MRRRANASGSRTGYYRLQGRGDRILDVAAGDVTGDGEKELIAGNDHLYAWTWSGIELLDDDNDPQSWGVFAVEINTIVELHD